MAEQGGRDVPGSLLSTLKHSPESGILAGSPALLDAKAEGGMIGALAETTGLGGVL